MAAKAPIPWSEHIDRGEIEKYLEGKDNTEQGRIIHSYLENQTDVDGTQWEELVTNGDQVVGRYDCLDKDTGVLYEFKTKTPRGMGGAPWGKDVNQIQKYLDAVEDAGLGYLVYIDRENFNVESYHVWNE
jgi:hypothetical protein